MNGKLSATGSSSLTITGLERNELGNGDTLEAMLYKCIRDIVSKSRARSHTDNSDECLV